jgi:hypothetical protein
MPFKSSAQRAYMFIHHPDIAKEFQAATPKGTKLPKHVKKSDAKSRAHSGFMKGLSKGGY